MVMRPLIAALIATALSPTAHPQKPSQIHGEGCVEPGAESRCLVARDLKSGNLYSLLFKGIQPSIGSGIEFTGMTHQGVTTCMQGTAIDVQTWKAKESLKCKSTAPSTQGP
jgi:hypothetical protein